MTSTGALTSLQRELTGDRRTALVMLLGATVLLLLVTCANVTNLLLSQAAARRHEIAVRAVLGASRARIVRQLLTESVMLAASGTLIGVALAPVMLGTMRALMPSELAGLSPATLDLRVLTFAAILALVTGIGFGLWPALGATRDAPAETMKAGARTATGRGAGLARRALVSLELALTVVLLVGSLLMLRSFERLMSQDRGMRTERVGTLEMALGDAAGGRAARLRTIDGMLARISVGPGRHLRRSHQRPASQGRGRNLGSNQSRCRSAAGERPCRWSLLAGVRRLLRDDGDPAEARQGVHDSRRFPRAARRHHQRDDGGKVLAGQSIRSATRS